LGAIVCLMPAFGCGSGDASAEPVNVEQTGATGGADVVADAGRGGGVDGSLATGGSGGSSAADGAAAPIYWGAHIEGRDTYTSLRKADGGTYDNPPWDLDTWDLYEAHAGKKVALLGLGSAWWRCENGCGYKSLAYYKSVLDIVRNRGAIPFFTWASRAENDPSRPDSDFALATIIRGDHDAFLRTFAADAKAWGHPFFLRFDWEMNGDWYPWSEKANGNRAGEYAAMWRHVHDIFAAAGATNVTWTWCPNVDLTGGTPLTELYPGDAYVDWLCMDGYNFGTNPLQPDKWKTFDEVMKPTYDQFRVLAPSKPIVVGETASTEIGGSKAAWIQEMLGASLPASFSGIRGVVWFNWNIHENGGTRDWAIETSQAAEDAFKAGIANAYYRAGSASGLANLPLLAPVAPP
jgi:hypothetical protein